MADWISSIARGYAAGNAIGQDIRTGAAQRRIDKNLPKFAQLDRDYNRAMEQGDSELANQIKAERDRYGSEVYRAADRLNALTGSNEGSDYLARVTDSYSNPNAPMKQGIGSRIKGAFGRDKPQSYDPSTATAAPATAPEQGASDPALEQYAALDSDYQKAMQMGDTPLAEQIKAERDALNINDGFKDVAMPTRVAAKAGKNPYETMYQQLGFRQRLSESAGRQFDPAAMEKVNAEAAASIYGTYFAPARDAAVATAKENGKWTNEQAHQLAGSIKTLSMYTPQFKDAVIEVDEATGGIYIDLTGGEASDAISITSPEDLAQADSIFERLQNPSGLLGRQVAGRQAEQQRRLEATEKMGYKAQEAALEVIKNATGSDGAKAVASSMAAAGFKDTPMTPEEQETYKAAAPNVTWQTKVETGAGTYLIGKQRVGGTEANPIYGIAIYDTRNGAMVEDTAKWAAFVDENRNGAAGSANDVLRAFQAAAQSKVDDINLGIQILNAATKSVISGTPFTMEAQSLSGIQTGGQAGTGGKPAEGLFPPEKISNAQSRGYVTNISANVMSPQYQEKYGPPPEGNSRAMAEWLLPALVWQESRNNPNAVSPAGAVGRYQIMPEFAAKPGYGVKPIDPRTASEAEQKEYALSYLTAMIDKAGGDWHLGLAGYNGGEGTIKKSLANAGPMSAPTASAQLARAATAPSGAAPPAAIPPKKQAPPAPAQAAATAPVSSPYAMGAAPDSRFGPLPSYATLPHNALSKADGGIIALTPEYFNSIRQE